MDFGLRDKVAIVTGSGRGIGAATARSLGREGARVVVTDINPDTTQSTVKALQGEGMQAIGVVADITRKDEVERLVETAAKTWGSVHILVNNAGFPRDNYITKMSDDDWDKVIEVTLKGAFLCCRAVMPYMMAQKWGRIINIASRAYLGNPGQANYSAGKAGVLGLTRALSLESGKFNITVNAIAPGFIKTELVESLPHYEKIAAKAIAAMPVPRVGEPEDIADAVTFLASERSGYICGETLHVTGGRYG